VGKAKGAQEPQQKVLGKEGRSRQLAYDRTEGGTKKNPFGVLGPAGGVEEKPVRSAKKSSGGGVQNELEISVGKEKASGNKNQVDK